MAEPDVAGISGFLGGADDAPSVFRGRSSVEINYKDVSGLVKEMNRLADAIKRVKTGLESLNSAKAQKALADLQGATGKTGGSTMQNGGNHSFGGEQAPATAAGGGSGGAAAPPAERVPNGGGRFPALGAAALGAAGLIGYSYARREQSDLASDITSIRTVYTSDRPSFGLREANRYASQGLAGAMLSREDRAQAMTALTGRYGMAGGTGMNQAMSMATAYGALSMQGAGFGADIVNRLNDPTVLNRVRMFGGGTRPSWGAVGAMGSARTMANIAFGSELPSMAQLSNFRPGTRQYENMLYLAGGDAQLATMQVEMMRADRRSRAMGAGPLTDRRLAGLSNDTDMQRRLFGEESLFMSKQRLESGKVVNAEEALDAARANLVTSNQWLSSIDNSLKDINKKFTQFAGPLGNMLNSLAGPLGQIGQIASNLVLASAVSGGGGGGLLGGAKGAAGAVGRFMTGNAGATTSGLRGVATRAASRLALPATMFAAGTGALTGDKRGDLPAWLGGDDRKLFGMDTGTFTDDGNLSVPGIARDAGSGLWRVGSWLNPLGDPVDELGRRVEEMQRVGDPAPGGGMSVSEADAILRSRAGNPGQVAGLKPDFKVKLGQLFQMNPRLTLTSGHRSNAEQERIYRQRYRPPYPGAPLDAPGWVHVSGAPAAKPGRSNHGFGLAADIGPSSQYGWLAANAPRVGLVKPMSYEPWHWEPPNARSRRGEDGGGSTTPTATDSGAVTGTASAAPVGATVRRARSGLGSTRQGGPGHAPEAGATVVSYSPGGGTAIGGAASTWSGGGGSISINQAADFLRQAGVPESQIPTGVAIGMAESSLRPGAHNPVPPDNSYGIWQINMINRLGPDRRNKLGIPNNEALFDPATNARAAAMISGGGTNWNPWTTYGKHEKYMGQVQSALASGVGDPVEGGGSSSPSMPSMVMMGGGGRGPSVVAPITLQVMQATEEEAIRMAKIIQSHLMGTLKDIDTARVGG